MKIRVWIIVLVMVGCAMLSGCLTKPYMIVDLSAGQTASHYPVSYMTAVPTGGWTDDYKTTKMVFRRIPAGTFTMGSPTNELGYRGETQHQVTLTQPFYIGVFEVTQKQWERVMGTWPSAFTNASCRDARPVERVSYDMIRGANAGADWPCNNDGFATNSVDADSFMGRLRARTGKAFDLPTESQWEYAGRAGTTTTLNSGKNLTDEDQCPNMSEVGRYYHNGGSGYFQSGAASGSGDDSVSWNPSLSGDASVASAIVGSYLPNAWGLYDIHGNVNEWCLDWWHLDSYGTDPGTVIDPVGELLSPCPCRVNRGGGWASRAWGCRVACRADSDPGEAGGIDLGFRVALPTGQ